MSSDEVIFSVHPKKCHQLIIPPEMGGREGVEVREGVKVREGVEVREEVEKAT